MCSVPGHFVPIQPTFDIKKGKAKVQGYWSVLFPISARDTGTAAPCSLLKAPGFLEDIQTVESTGIGLSPHGGMPGQPHKCS